MCGSYYRFTDAMHDDYPTVEGLLSKGHKYDFETSVFRVLDGLVFHEQNPEERFVGEEDKQYVQVLGLLGGKRTWRWIKRNYLDAPDNFESYKVILPAANGSGAIGEVLSTPLIGEPLIGYTRTFISIGRFDTREEAEACLKYVKSKFARTMLGILKITQHNPPAKWKYVPLQDFTKDSDIDWSKPVAGIDQQLYQKYGLSAEEIEFIETRVKEMN